MSKFLKTAAAAAVLALSAGAQAEVIDLFTTSQAPVVDSLGGGATSTQAGALGDATILGGFRDLSVEVKAAPIAGQTAQMDVTGGFLSFSNQSSVSSTGIVRWDGANSLAAIDTGGLGGLNIGNALTDSFELTTVFSDGGYTFTLEAYTDANTWSRVTLQATSHPLSIPGTKSYIPMAAFLDCGFNAGGITVVCGAGGAVDFTNVGALQAIIDPLGTAAALDLTLNQVVTVPEPGSLALVGLALLGIGAARRRKA